MLSSVMQLSVIIPVYNEVNTIKEILDKVSAAQVKDSNNKIIEKQIIIVESNSTDGTREAIQEYLKAKKQSKGINNQYRLILQDKPRGKGNALKDGLKQATGDIILIQDADLEYDPIDYQRLIDPIINNKTQFVLGSRHMGPGYWNIRNHQFKKGYYKLLNLGHLIFTELFNMLYNTTLTDPATMYKVFTREALQQLQKTNMKSNYFDLDWEIVAKLVKQKYLPTEIPVSYQSRTIEQGKKIRFFRDGFLVAKAIVYFRFFD